MPRAGVVSAGLLMYRRAGQQLQFLLAHPGGPFYARKDEGVWTIPKGQVNPDEDLLSAARREFQEETSFSVAAEHFSSLGSVVQKSGKRVFAWAFEGDCDPLKLVSNTCSIQWPPRSGRMLTIPEIDRAEFFDVERANRAILEAQRPFLERAVALLESSQ